jgi:hypothetical protein
MRRRIGQILQLNIEITVKSTDGYIVETSEDLTGANLIFSVKKNLKDEEVILEKEAEITDAKKGKAFIFLTSEDNNQALGTYYWDLWLDDAEGNQRPIIGGQLLYVNKVRNLPEESGSE